MSANCPSSFRVRSLGEQLERLSESARVVRIPEQLEGQLGRSLGHELAAEATERVSVEPAALAEHR